MSSRIPASLTLVDSLFAGYFFLFPRSLLRCDLLFEKLADAGYATQNSRSFVRQEHLGCLSVGDSL